jgi:type IV pilus assembly protein PilE
MKTPVGFTLIELLITMSVFSILSVIGYPSYIAYLQVSHRTDAHMALSKLANQQEQFFLHNERYAELQELMPATIQNEYITEHGFYRITIATLPSTYKLTAVAIGSQIDDIDCQFLTLSQSGLRDSTSHERCW